MPNEIPTVIADMIAQLGGAQIFRMAFASSTYTAGVENAPHAACLVLKIAPALVRESRSKATHVIVELGWDDVYTVKLVKQGKMNRKTYQIPDPVELANVPMVYADTLRATVERETGFLMRLF